MGIQWDPKLSVGVQEIDGQHQELFLRVNALLDAMQQGEGEDVTGNLLAFLERYVVEHFGAEQRLMRRHGYPQAAQHEALHEGFMRTFRDVAAEYRKKGPTVGLAVKVNQLVCPWLRMHIGSADRALGEFLTAARPARATA